MKILSYEEFAEEWNRKYPDYPATEDMYDGYLDAMDGPE